MQLIGREHETTDVIERLRERRLVTITGPGGIGKTALARIAAEAVGSEFEKGVVTVDLTRVDEAVGVYEAIAAQLGYADFESLIDSPSDQPVLILVGNCEHVLGAAADSAARMLEACQMPTILATSRSPLELPQESILTLGPLPLPYAVDDSPDAPAVRLLVDRARHQGVDLAAADPSTLAEICRKVDGVPLAIELAAASMRTAAPVDVLRGLESRPHTLGRRTFRGQQSHRSVGEMVRWSLDLLRPQLRRVFCRYGVFAGPFTGRMADDMTAEIRPPGDGNALDELVAASLVAVEQSTDTTWYRLLHPVRAVALDELTATGELLLTQSRLVDVVIELANEVVHRATAGWDSDVLNDLIALYDNVAASLRWVIARDEQPHRALTLLAALWGLVDQTHTTEIATLGEATLQRWPDAEGPILSDALATIATCRMLTGDVAGAIEVGESSLEAADKSHLAGPLMRRVLAQSYRIRGDLSASRRLFHEGAEHAAADELHGIAMELRVDEAIVAGQMGDFDEGLAITGDVEAEAARRQAPINRVWAMIGRAAVLLERSPDEALPVIERAMRESRSVNYPNGRSCSARLEAAALLAADDQPGAARTLFDLIDELLVTGGLNDMRMALDLAAVLLERTGHPRWADVGATADALPITTVLLPVTNGTIERARDIGIPLSRREAFTTCRRALRSLARPTDSPDRDRLYGPRGNEMVLEGDVWRIGYADTVVRFKASKGLQDLATLLGAPGREISCLDLMGSVVSGASSEDDTIDARARHDYESRIRELQASIEEAEERHDLGAIERLRMEMDAIVDELTSATGLGGRTRRTSGAAERARSAVTQRLRSTIKRIDKHHPRLGAHLDIAISTGLFCSYDPPEPTVWQITRA